MFRAHVASLVLFVSLFLAGRAVFRTTVDSERTTFSSVKVSSRLTKVTPGLLTDPGGHRAISGTGCTLQEDLLTAQLVEVIGPDGQSSWLQHTSLKVEPTDLDLVDHEESTSQDDAPPIDKLSKNDSSKTNVTKFLEELDLKDNYFSVRGELVFVNTQKKEIVIKIKSTPKLKNLKNTIFKLVIKGELSLELLHSFVSLDINRDGNSLKLIKYEVIEKDLSENK